MNYVFVKPDDEYPSLYRHDVYGGDNPRLIDCYKWNYFTGHLTKGDYNLSLTVL